MFKYPFKQLPDGEKVALPEPVSADERGDLLCADVPFTTIQKLLGHRWLETTQIYVQANDKQVAADYYAACEKLGDW